MTNVEIPDESVNSGSNMKFFTKKESLITMLILALIALVSIPNFKVALRRERDANRKADIGNILKGLSTYYKDFGFYPPSSPDGRIIACKKEGINELTKLTVKEKDLETKLKDLFAPCDWGKDSLRDVFDKTYPAYIGTLPADPDTNKGVRYMYFSDTQHIQLYASLEGSDEAEYSEAIVGRNLSCGTQICNFGRASGTVPLDKSIEEYNQEQLNKGK
jgi:type II secretory pathway pseudopilin PulG